MSETELSLSQHEQAVKLHNRIMASASLAQQSLWEMCTGLKEMRDGKLYKEFGYQNFEDYCENEVGFSREQGRKYISIIENVSFENANSSWHLGVTKLYLLSTISESEQKKITEKVNLEETTVKRLKAEIDKLKGENSELERKSRFDDAEKRSLQARLDDTGKAMRSAMSDKQKAEERARNESERANSISRKLEQQKDENVRLERENEDLRNRPTEVAFVDNSAEYEEKLKIALETANQENRQHETELEEKFRAENEAIRQELEKEKQTAISEIRSDYEKKLSESAAAAPVDEDKLKFKVYLTSAYDTLSRLLEFASQHTEPIYKEKIKQLLNNVLTNMEDPLLWRN